MRRLLYFLVLLAAIAAIVWLVFETKAVAEFAGQQQIEARAATARATAAEREVARLEAANGSAIANGMRLEGELGKASAQLAAMADTVTKVTEGAARRAAAADVAAQQALQAPPDGVRLCLQGLHDCLRADGFTGQRFLTARSIDGDGLHDVEMLDTHADGLGVAVLQAGLMTAELDRGAGKFVLRFFDGFRSDRGERVALHKDGFPIVFEPIDGHLLEERLPFLVRAAGVYPIEPPSRRERAPTDLDSTTRLQWLERFDQLLAAAGTTEELRINRFRGIAEAHFLEVQLLGTDSKHHLQLAADCKRLAVEVDAKAGVVSLLLLDGVLRRAGVESTITGQGYRMLLPKVTPKMANDLMLGMVVTK